MNIQVFRKFCLNKKAVTEDFPFGEDTLCFRVMGKIFAITSFNIPFRVNLKCDPEKAVDLRERFEEVQPGYHMNKIHWNTVTFDGSLPDKLLKEMTDDSYNLIVKGLTKKLKDELLNL